MHVVRALRSRHFCGKVACVLKICLVVDCRLCHLGLYDARLLFLVYDGEVSDREVYVVVKLDCVGEVDFRDVEADVSLFFHGRIPSSRQNIFVPLAAISLTSCVFLINL